VTHFRTCKKTNAIKANKRIGKSKNLSFFDIPFELVVEWEGFLTDTGLRRSGVVGRCG